MERDLYLRYKFTDRRGADVFDIFPGEDIKRQQELLGELWLKTNRHNPLLTSALLMWTPPPTDDKEPEMSSPNGGGFSPFHCPECCELPCTCDDGMAGGPGMTVAEIVADEGGGLPTIHCPDCGEVPCACIETCPDTGLEPTPDSGVEQLVCSDCRDRLEPGRKFCGECGGMGVTVYDERPKASELSTAERKRLYPSVAPLPGAVTEVDCILCGDTGYYPAGDPTNPSSLTPCSCSAYKEPPIDHLHGRHHDSLEYRLGWNAALLMVRMHALEYIK